MPSQYLGRCVLSLLKRALTWSTSFVLCRNGDGIAYAFAVRLENNACLVYFTEISYDFLVEYSMYVVRG
jgi:hypothetical protein